MIILLITAVGLVLWSLRLVQSAFKLREFSLIFAGTLVGLSAIGVITVYLLMDGCLGYIASSASALPEQLSPSPAVQQVSLEWVDR